MRENLIGKNVGNYEILKELGRGGMGIVYKAHQTSLGRSVALKILPWGLESDPEYLQRFRREALAAAQLSHPNIVTVYDISSDGHMHFIAMEYVEGKELADIITQRGRLGTHESLSIAHQVASALGAAHALNVIHRDIKPRNIMIDATGRAKVMDFGIAKLTSANTKLTQAGLILGTPEYMSPEQIQGLEIDSRSDLYALGVVLWQMLAGAVPYQATTPLAVLRKIVDDPIPAIRDFKPRLPDSVVHLLEKSLAKDPEDRYATGREMEEEIARILYSGELPEDETEFPPPKFTAPPPTSASRKVTQAAGLAGGQSGRVPDPQIAPTPTGPVDPSAARRKTASLLLVAGIVLLAVAGIVTSQRKNGGGKPPEKAISSSSPGDGAAPPAVVPPVAKPPVPPPPAPAVVLPVLRWKEAPAEGAEVKEGKITLSWDIANDALSNGFLVGLNDPSPKLIVKEMSKSFDLAKEGEQVVTIIPLNENNVKGEELKRTFVYKPGAPPTIKGKLAVDSLLAGQPGKFNLTVTDPRKEKVNTEARLNGGDWTPVVAAEKAMAALPPGKHTAEIRATNASGVSSEIWSCVFEIKQTAPPAPGVAPVAEAPMPIPAAAAPAKAASGKIVSSAGGTYASVAEAIAKSPAGSRLTIGPGKYAESIVIDKKLDIVGGGPRDEVVIEAPAGACVVIKGGGATLRGLTLRALASKGEFTQPKSGEGARPSQAVFGGEFAGALHVVSGEPTIEDCSLASSFSQALLVDAGANPALRKCVIKGKGRASAATFAEGAKGKLEDCDITGAFLWGVDVRAGASPTLTRCRIHAFEFDGVYFDAKSAGTLDDCDVFDNESHGITIGPDSTAQIRGSRVIKNGMEGISAPQDTSGVVENSDLTRNGGLGAYNLSMGAKKTLKLNNNKDE